MQMEIIHSHYKVNISNDKAVLYEKIMSVEFLVIVIIVFKHYPGTYCSMQGGWFLYQLLEFEKILTQN